MESSQARREAKKDLSLLSLDGGGMRVISQLFIIKKIMTAIDPQAPPKPSDVFDLICGTSSGGLIAIMLGRLRMPVEEAIDSYIALSRSEFEKKTGRMAFDFRGRLNPRYSSEGLTCAVQEVIKQRGMQVEEPLCEPDGHSPTTVVTAQRVDNSSLELLSSDGSLDHGSGHVHITSVPENGFDFVTYLARLATETERVADLFVHQKRDMALANNYFRFSVLRGLEDVGFDETSKLGLIATVSARYCEEQQTLLAIQRCAERLRESNNPLPRDDDPHKGNNVRLLVEQHAEKPPNFNTEHHPTHASPPTKTYSPPENIKNFTSLIETTSRCLLTDTEMESLLSAAVGKIADTRLKKNLAILLEDFAQRLTKDHKLESLAHFIGSRTLDVVDQMLSRLPPSTQSTMEIELPSYEDAMSAKDEVEDLGETQRKFRTLDSMELSIALLHFDVTILKRSLPFTELKEELRRFVFPSMKSYIRGVIEPLLPVTKLIPIYSVAIHVHWELEDYIAREFDAGDDIENIVTLTGDYARAQALPCGEYVRQSWPQTGAATLAAVKHVLLEGYSYYQYSPTHSVRLEFEERDEIKSEKITISAGRLLLVRVSGRPVEVVETIEQLAWFASAFRSLGKSSTALSQVDFRVVLDSSKSLDLMAELILLPLRSYTDTEPNFGSCWLPLMKSSVLAWGFPVAERGKAVGLEIPFQLMLKACGARFPVEFQNSILIRQDPLTIFPIAKHHQGIQWHAVVGKLDVFFDKIKTFPILPVEESIDSIIQARSFVGWLSRAHTRLGTFRPNDEASGTSLDNKRGRMLGDDVSINANIRLPWMDVVSGSVGTKILLPKSQMQRIEAMQLGYEQSMQRSLRTSAIYYDYISKTGWLVPELSLILHVVYAALLEHSPSLEALYHIPYARLEVDGARAALAAIQDCASVVLWKTGEDKEFCFKDLIEFYLILFDNRKESMRIRLEHNELRADLGLRGWDFADLRDNTAFYSCRLIHPPPFSGRPQWWDLAHNPNLLVVFGSKLTQVIVPDRSSARPCSSWAEIPGKCNLLVGSVRCIEQVCRPWETSLPRMQFSDNLVWHQPERSNPFNICTGQVCNPVQKLKHLGFWSRLRNPGPIEPDGAVIFGRPKDVRKHIRTPCGPLPIQNHVPHDRIYLATKTQNDSYLLISLNWFKHLFKTDSFKSFLFRFLLILCIATIFKMFI